jgi:putative ABC transport system permease protein
MKGIRRLFRLASDARRIDAEVDDELRFHVESRADDLAARGHAREAAIAMARREFGDLDAARDELAAIDRRRATKTARADWWSDLRQDARIAVRGFARQPGFTIVALLTLALGIGANGTIFSVVEAVLIRPLPYRDSDRLVHLWETKLNDPADISEASYPDFLDWRREADIFTHVEGYDETNVTIGDDAGAERARGGRVTPGFFRMLGVEPILGRSFRDDDDVLGSSAFVILSHHIWQRRYGGDRAVVGRSIQIDGAPVTIVGVLPRDFRFAPVGDADLWFTPGRSAQTRGERFNHWLRVVGRLHGGVTVDQARGQMSVVMNRLAAQYPETNSGRGIRIVSLRDEIVGPVQPVVTALLGAVVILLLIACANVASLVLARSIERGSEIAVRTALGASRQRLVRQLTTESLLLALAGGILGAWVAMLGVRFLVSAMPASLLDQMPHLYDVRVNGMVLWYTAAVTGVAGLAFGVAPAVYVSRGSGAELLRSAGRGNVSVRGRQRTRDALVAIEIACALVLVVGASLMARSLTSLLRVDPGFVAHRVVTGRIALAGPQYEDEGRQQRYFEELLARVRALPGVEVAGAVSSPPLQGGGTNTFRVEGEPEPPAAARPEATMRGVAGDYFRTLNISLVAGRVLSSRDDTTAMPAMMINESLARRLFGDRSALGGKLRFYAFPESAWTIIGVVGDVKTGSLDAPVPPTIYYSHLQGAANRMNIMARTSGDPDALALAMARITRAMDAGVPIYSVATMDQQISGSSAVLARRYPLLLIGVFAVAALVLSIVGVYGVIAYSVAQRTRELALRIALGATTANVTSLVMKRGVALAATGLLLGIPAALVLTRFMSSMLYGVSSADPLTYGAAALGITAIALAGCYLPARRAADVDPATALRSE